MEKILSGAGFTFARTAQTDGAQRTLGQCSDPGGLRTVTVRDFDALAAHIPAWDRLAWEAPQKIPVMLPDWVDVTLRHRLGPKERWFCCFAYAGDRLVGALPIIAAPHPVLGHHRPRLRTLYDEHTPSGDFVLAADQAGAALRALLAEVAREAPRHQELELKAVRQCSPAWIALQDEPKGYLLHPEPCWKKAFLDVRGDADRYFAGLGKMRRNLRLGRQKLEKQGAVSVELRRGAEAGDDFLAEFLALEASGWKGRMGTAILNDPDLVAFYTRLVRNFAAKGRLEWHAIRVEGRLVAAQLGIRCGTSLMLPKYAYNEDFADCWPGHLLIEEVIRDAFARPEIAELNPMSDGSQHRLFHMARDEYANVRLIRRTVVSVSLRLVRSTARSVYRDHLRPRVHPVMKQLSGAFHRRLKLRRSGEPGKDQGPLLSR
jgi:CelD/BcsL family acetyltransferase involved in cellulose biosynthesis